MLAGRVLVVRPREDRPLGRNPIARRGESGVAAIGGDAIAARGDAEDFVVVHRHSETASGM
jgi:hypothetical protein